MRPETSAKYEKIKQLISDGETVASACKKVGLVTSAFYYYKNQDIKNAPGVVTVHSLPKKKCITRKSTIESADFVIITNPSSLKAVLGALR